jgi:Na+/melibiose symporter-like transporter
VAGVRDGLSKTHEWAYSIGHLNNDLCAAMWFVYLTWYVNNVVGLSSTVSGLVLLSGQITDGITTPTVGYLSDKLSCPGGKRNFWYYFGFSFVNVTFLAIFTDPPFFGEAPNINTTFQNAWYLTMPAIFNIAWASVQVAHLSIVNGLTYGQRRRDKLIN